MNIYNMLFFCFVFFSSLRITSPVGIYLFSIVMPLIMLLGLFITIKGKLKVSRISIIIVLCIIFSWFLISIFPQYEIIINDKQYILAIVICLASGFFIKTIRNYLIDKDILLIINSILFFHLVTFFIQYLSWYILSIDLDYGTITNGSAHRAMYYGALYRSTGIFEEPSIYSGYVFSFITIKYFYDKKISILSYIALLSMALTFSTIGIILALLFVLIINLRVKIIYVFISILIFIFIYNIVGDYIIDRVLVIANGNDGSTNTKFFVLKEYINNINVFLHGVGFIYKEKMLIDSYNGSGDLTLFINAPTIFGVFGIFIPFVLLVRIINSRCNIRLGLIVILSFFKMASFHHPYFWVYYFFVLYFILIKKNEKKNHE